MKTIRLSGKKMTTIESTHRYLQRRLSFPDYYGGNLDALWDMLSTISGSWAIRIIHVDYMLNALGTYGGALIQLFKDADKANPNLQIVFKP